MTARPSISAELEVALDASVDTSFPIQEVDGCAVVGASGEIDILTAPALRGALDAAAESSDRVIIDLTDVTFLDSSGIGAMLGALHRNQRRQESSLVLVGPRTMVRKVLHITCLSSEFPIYASVDEAVAQQI